MKPRTPGWRLQVMLLGSFLVLGVPAIMGVGLGYVALLRGFGVDVDTRPESFGQRLTIFLGLLPLVPLMVLTVLTVGLPWMWGVSRWAPWREIEALDYRRGPRWPWLSDWLERRWQRLLEARRRREARRPRE